MCAAWYLLLICSLSIAATMKKPHSMRWFSRDANTFIQYWNNLINRNTANNDQPSQPQAGSLGFSSNDLEPISLKSLRCCRIILPRSMPISSCVSPNSLQLPIVPEIPHIPSISRHGRILNICTHHYADPNLRTTSICTPACRH